MNNTSIYDKVKLNIKDNIINNTKFVIQNDEFVNNILNDINVNLYYNTRQNILNGILTTVDNVYIRIYENIKI